MRENHWEEKACERIHERRTQKEIQKEKTCKRKNTKKAISLLLILALVGTMLTGCKGGTQERGCGGKRQDLHQYVSVGPVHAQAVYTLAGAEVSRL